MIKSLQIGGFKSFANAQKVNFSGLTLLAGANSSGKSSFMQPLLLLKQTIECQYDPGSILLDGPNVKLSESSQALSRVKSTKAIAGRFWLEIGLEKIDIGLAYQKGSMGRLPLKTMALKRAGSDEWLSLSEGVTITEEMSRGIDSLGILPANFFGMLSSTRAVEYRPQRDRCFFQVACFQSGGLEKMRYMSFPLVSRLTEELGRLIHIPGLRGNPERSYRTTGVAENFPGTYEYYMASIIWSWQMEGDDRLLKLGEQLRFLGLTWKVSARQVQDTRVELRVGRLPHPVRGGAKDLVSVADVGLGVAQVLPVLVALIAAKRGQIVYIEQPELHLHPRAQWRLADIVCDSVKRGVRVVIETHSSVFIRGIQTNIALSKLESSLVSLNWFSRDLSEGYSVVDAVVPASDGSFGEWPADFDDVSLDVDAAYLDAVSK